MGRPSTALSAQEEAMVVGFRRHSVLPLDDCLYALQATIPQLTRSSLHRCLQRYGISSVPEAGQRVASERVLGHFRIDIAEVRTLEGPLRLFLAIDRVSKLIYSEAREKATQRESVGFLLRLIEAVPYRIRSVRTERRPQFAARPFAAACVREGIEQHLTELNYPWTPQQVARVKRLLKQRREGQYAFATRRQAEQLARQFRLAYNFERRLKSLRGLTPYAFICRMWAQHPQWFRFDPARAAAFMYEARDNRDERTRVAGVSGCV